MKKYRIPFHKTFIGGAELQNIAESIASGDVAGDGSFTKRCQDWMQASFGAKRVLLTTSCTSALEMAAILCDLQPGDEVVLPSYTFVSTANAFLLRGARLRFVDIREDTLNMDEQSISALLTDRTRAIVPVHYAGISCEMDAISALARRHGLRVIEDAAQGVNATYHGAYLGTLGDLGSYSFHSSKNFSCGEGGALVVRDDALIERAEIIREKGTDRSKFFRGQVDKYTWVDIGSSYVLADVLAAFLFAQLQRVTEITAARKRVYDTYRGGLKPLADAGRIRLPVVPEGCTSNYHMFYVLMDSLSTRTALIEHLKKKGILAVFHYVPLHTSPMGRSLGYTAGMLPVTESLSERIVRLPLYPELDNNEIMEIVAAIHEFFSSH